nr:MAG TPA: cytochrome c-555 [Caudoviricetes sp.]
MFNSIINVIITSRGCFYCHYPKRASEQTRSAAPEINMMRRI